MTEREGRSCYEHIVAGEWFEMLDKQRDKARLLLWKTFQKEYTCI